MTRGRPRTSASAPLDKSKLPKSCYWDSSYSGHWYTVFTVDGKQRRKKIAGAEATLAELYRILEEKSDPNCLNWLADKFEKSTQFRLVSSSQQKSYQYARSMVSLHPTKKPGLMIGQASLDNWRPSLVQKLIDSLAEKRGPSAAKKAKEYLNRLFNWSMNRGYVDNNPVGKPEMPKERKLQRLPDRLTLSRLVRFAKERGSQAKLKGSCAPYIWIALEICRKCRFRGIEAFTLCDAQLLDQGIESRRRKGSKDNITLWDDGLQAAVNAAIARRKSICKTTNFRAEDRIVIVGTSGQPISQRTWQSAWARFMSIAIQEGIITLDQKFGLHDMKRRGVTDTPGTRADKLDASGLSDNRVLSVYDKSLPAYGAAPD